MSFTKAEVAPLVGGRRETNVPRRRVPQVRIQEQRHSCVLLRCASSYSSFSLSCVQHLPTFEQSMYSVDASEKMDRRSLCNRLCTQAKHDCCVGKAGELDVNYYEDTYNDEPWGCTFGTGENNGTWTNYGDKVGTIMSSMVWMLYMFAMLTMTLLAKNNKLRPPVAMIFITLASLALAAHGKTMLTDPGSIPQEAVPLPILFKRGVTTHAMCSHCQTYKPPGAHHCRICNRCISGMDHHCPWMNNCVGANNFSKQLQL